ncbi:glycosyltransferase family 4 protein [Staphylococcus simulans]|uniref:glycosyltransferase family 4 protein n=1 Tax=Staphylococcus simulans TaxID=1286 RepID=UPI00399B39E5
MKILHLNSNFIFTQIYRNQIENMSNDFEHVIYNPVKKSVKFNSDYKYELHAPQIIKKSDSLFSLNRKNKSLKYLNKSINMKDVNLIHAHTLTNDGLLAYALHKRYKVPYILTIRGTDVNFSLPYKIHLRGVFKNALKQAKVLIFPNHNYKNKVLSFFKNDKDIVDKLEKSIVIPNGIDSFWLENARVGEKERNSKKEIQLLYVGRIYSNKNIHRVLDAICTINAEGDYFIKMNIVGKIISEKYFEELKKVNDFKYYGVRDKSEIKQIMDGIDIFTMPSKSETFGLVFVEAMSQNLPIIYTKNEGIYDYFEDGIYGKATDYKNSNEIKENILHILENYDEFQRNLKDKEFLNEFRWNEIGEIYNDLYKESSQ